METYNREVKQCCGMGPCCHSTCVGAPANGVGGVVERFLFARLYIEADINFLLSLFNCRLHRQFLCLEVPR